MKDEVVRMPKQGIHFFLIVCLFVHFFWGGGGGGVWIAIYFVQDGFWLWGCKTPSKSIFDTRGSV